VFTGIIENKGAVESIEVQEDLARLVIRAPQIAADVKLGDSVAVNGTCLTVVESDGERLSFDAVRETLERTALGDLKAGSEVNLERAMRADGRFDGHIVQGHVDGVGRVARLTRQGDDVQLFIECDKEFAELLVDKGSVAIDGVSLTVVTVGEAGFDVILIPHTLVVTTMGDFEAGRRVNLEADILGKYVKTYLQRVLPATGG
jgi:riboflavin synthase